MLKNLQEHCSDLALIINPLGFSEAHDWLMIASGIESMNFSWNRYDKTGQKQYCRPAYEYDVSKGVITLKYINQLTIFNYIWGAFENLSSKIFTKSKINKIGKVNCVIKLTEDKGFFPVYQYEKIKSSFYLNFRNVLQSKLLIYEKKNFSNELKIVYELRNKFAHGNMEFPEDIEYSDNYRNPILLINLIEISSRVVLCYIQSITSHNCGKQLVYSFFDNLFENIEMEDYDDDLFFADYILSRIHLKNIPVNDMHMTLFGEYYYMLDF